MLNSEQPRQTILVGEDESEVRGFLEMTLRCQGYQVELAEDGDEVLAHLRDRPPVSAVLLDIMMPNKDGMETLREIRRIDGDLPVVMLSGVAAPIKIVEAMKFGATDFLAKPVNHEHLRQALRKAIDVGGRPMASPAAAPAAPALDRMFYGSHSEMRDIRAVIRK